MTGKFIERIIVGAQETKEHSCKADSRCLALLILLAAARSKSQPDVGRIASVIGQL